MKRDIISIVDNSKVVPLKKALLNHSSGGIIPQTKICKERFPTGVGNYRRSCLGSLFMAICKTTDSCGTLRSSESKSDKE